VEKILMAGGRELGPFKFSKENQKVTKVELSYGIPKQYENYLAYPKLKMCYRPAGYY
jgi:hypothetical protein